MFDNRVQYAILAAEDRLRSRQSRISNRGVKRIFRLAGDRAASRPGQR